MSDIKFGTDGWRGRIADDYTFANLRRCAQGFAGYIRAIDPHGAVVVGYDRRFLAEHFAAAAAEVLAGNGLHVYLTPTATPTPVISYGVTVKNALGAVNVTASHNPPEDCGFKVRDAHGGAVDPEGLAQIESLIPPADEPDAVLRLPLSEAIDQGKVEMFDAKPAYLAHLAGLIDVEPIRQAGLKVVVDNMGQRGRVVERDSGRGPHRDRRVHAARNPIFPEMKRPEPIPPNIDAGLAVGRCWRRRRVHPGRRRRPLRLRR